jgi:hypothetical protein
MVALHLLSGKESIASKTYHMYHFMDRIPEAGMDRLKALGLMVVAGSDVGLFRTPQSGNVKATKIKLTLAMLVLGWGFVSWVGFSELRPVVEALGIVTGIFGAFGLFMYAFETTSHGKPGPLLRPVVIAV